MKAPHLSTVPQPNPFGKIGPRPRGLALMHTPAPRCADVARPAVGGVKGHHAQGMSILIGQEIGDDGVGSARLFAGAKMRCSFPRNGVRGASRSGSASVITTHALFARKVQRKLSNGVAGFAPPDHLLIERDRGQFVPSRRRRMMANVRARLLKTPAEPSPELRISGAAAQTRVVSLAGIRLGSWESARAFKGIICDDISEKPHY
jgi:hypothetical protein